MCKFQKKNKKQSIIQKKLLALFIKHLKNTTMKKLAIFALFLFGAQHSFAQFLGASGTGNGFIYNLKVNKGGYSCYSSSKMTVSGNYDYTVFPSGIIYDQNYYTFGGSAQFLATNEAYHRFQRTQNVLTVNLLGKTDRKSVV